MHLQADDTPVTTSAYDRDLLRKQIDILRQEAAIRARLEKEIFSEHERTTSSTIASAWSRQPLPMPGSGPGTGCVPPTASTSAVSCPRPLTTLSPA